MNLNTGVFDIELSNHQNISSQSVIYGNLKSRFCLVSLRVLQLKLKNTRGFVLIF